MVRASRRDLLAGCAVAAGTLAGCRVPLLETSGGTDATDSDGTGGHPGHGDWRPDVAAPRSVRTYWPDGGPGVRPGMIDNPILTYGDVHEVDAYSFADPFVTWTDRRAYMFFEVKHSGEAQDVGYATSRNFRDWTYQGLALRDDGRTYSYPFVTRRDGRWLMIPSLGIRHPQIEIYEARDFPAEWRVRETITGVAETVTADATVWDHDDTVYLTFEDYDTYEQGYVLRLFVSPSLLEGDWTEHPASPITRDTDSRPAGRPIVHEDGIDLFRQVRHPTYGRKVLPYRITDLSPEAYGERRLATAPTIAASEQDGAWNETGMHHVDLLPARRGVSRFVPVDGKDDSGTWSIGLYALEYRA